jgi:SNF2 family DNA or RNA helicase
MGVTLYDFQGELVAKLGRPEITGRLIGDEPGLGKTYECLAIDERLRDETGAAAKDRTLIIAPRSVHGFWAGKVREFDPQAKIAIIDRKDRMPFVMAVRRNTATFYICHYEALRIKDMSVMTRVQWFHVIADEVHRIKNPKAQQRIKVISLKAHFKTGASGSIADDKPQDMWSPLNWVAPTKFPSGGVKNPHKIFVRDWCEVEDIEGRWLGLDAQGNDRGNVTHQAVVGLNKARLDKFHATIAPFYMRRLKSEVGLELPSKYFTPINVKLYPSQQKVYDDLKRKFKAWIGEHQDEPLEVNRMFVVAQLVRLQQAALATLEWGDVGKVDRITGEPIRKVRLIEPSAKLDALVDWMQDRTTQTIIFSQSKSMIDLVGQRLRRDGLRVGLYHGDVPDAIKESNVDNFQAGKLDVFAGTIASGGESITLTASSAVVFLDRAWGPFKNRQAEDRAHRIGQVWPVQIVDFFAPGTVDKKVRDTNIRKWSILQELLGDDR